MVQLLSRYPKVIAWFFVSLFYLELVLIPATANGAVRPLANSFSRKANRLSFLPIKIAEHYFDMANSGAKKTLANSKVKAALAKRVTAAKSFEEKEKPEAVAIGPTQPEMASFQSVNANNLVDLFSGDFSYNIPLLDVGGYPVNLHYQSGITMDQEASWVGLGWNINPGVISRNMRGLPDDFKGGADFVRKTVSMKPNKTFGVSAGGDIELIGFPLNFKLELGAFHNTYKGWGTEIGINAAINAGRGAKGPLNGSLGLTNNSQSGLDISPSIGYKMASEEAKTKGGVTIGTNFNSRVGIQSLQVTGEVKQSLHSDKKMKYSGGTSLNAGISFSKPSYTPGITMPFTSTQKAITIKMGTEWWGLHPSGFLRGYSSVQEIENVDKTQTLPAFGYLNYDAAGNDQRVLLDFNREKDVAYTNNSPHIAVPIYTYDTYSISGEGTGGMFRPYRGDIGMVYDNSVTSKSNSGKLSIDLGFGNAFHGGVDYTDAYSRTTNGAWISSNAMYDATRFKPRDTLFENVYFKNPGEKTAVNKTFLNQIGDDNLVRVALTPPGGAQHDANASASRNLTLFKGGRMIGVRSLSAQIKRSEREKRKQMISYLTGTEAAIAGLDKVIRAYPVNVFPQGNCSGFRVINRNEEGRQGHHISEMTVLNEDGKRYIYGIPVYNKHQAEVTMAVPRGNNNTGLVEYNPDLHKSKSNTEGKDGYFNKEEMAPYAHSFLLSGILSPDYVDLTGDGITEDDQGDAVKFNYTELYSYNSPFKWRAPLQKNMAFYNEGLKTDVRDERGSFTYGQREVWFLNSIESKTMIATFVLDDVERLDGKGVEGEDGGIDNNQKLRRLKEINLYAKADFAKNGVNAKPVKTVHFGYSYKLTKGIPGTPSDTIGKLTLDSVWFTYNKRVREVKNAYKFNYHASNPNYDHKMSDRWGSYKPSRANPGEPGNPMVNADYSYTLQQGNGNWNKDSADKNAASWTLSNIKLPSGGEIKVTYESDDYAYVQNKRAMQFYKLEGFGADLTGMFPFLYFSSQKDCNYVFIRVNEPVANEAEIRSKYLEGVDKLFFNLTVKMPADAGNFGTGSEIIPCYAEFDQVGVMSGDNTLIWARLKPLIHEESPTATAAIQFLRLNLPQKAYPFSEPGDNLDIRALLGMIATAKDNIENVTKGFSKYIREKFMARDVSLDRSFVRLNNPSFRKLGGGLRVSKVEVFDKWDKMTGGKEAVYGQEYSYSTQIEVNGQKKEISSGVASYEPAVGGDENPFHVPFKLYSEKVGALAPTDFMYTEEPFAETFFPSPSVGYSKVTVQSIHKTRKSATGITQTEFYTTKDFPTIVEITPVDGESKKTYNPLVQSFFRVDAKNYVTISQGFKVELNDMNGKLKSTISFAQTDLKNPISYTHNYYRLEQDNASVKKLSNKVSVIHNASGVVDEQAEIGKEVEIMIDVREQTTESGSRSAEANVDVGNWFPPIVFGSMIPIPTSEVNRFRSIAVLKVVNRYAILDSVVQIEKGSKVSTRNLVYDGETGDVLVTRTNNMFDDPVYNFTYPAHWAYTGMQGAYKNLGTVVNNIDIKRGISFKGAGRIDLSRYFESGDEILVKGKFKRSALVSNDPCHPDYYTFESVVTDSIVWAIDGTKSILREKGIFFIDRFGKPVTVLASSLKVIRSGKRNMSSVAVGSISSMTNPVKQVAGVSKIVIHDSIKVLSASAAKFKDIWKIEQVLRQYDSCVDFPHSGSAIIPITSYRNWWFFGGPNSGWSYTEMNSPYLVAGYLWRFLITGTNLQITRSLMKLDMSNVPDDAVITDARLNLFWRVPLGIWTGSGFAIPNLDFSYGGGGQAVIGHIMPYPLPHWENMDVTWVDQSVLDTSSKKVILPHRTTADVKVSYGNVDVKNLIQSVVGKPVQYQNLILKMENERPVAAAEKDRFMSFNGQYGSFPNGPTYCFPEDGIFPRGSSTSACGSYITVDFNYGSKTCYKVCRLEYLNQDTLNPYLVGMAGNWRPDTAYSYYSDRREASVDIATNIRKDGLIKDFNPYWTIGSADSIIAAPDPSRWVWNSKSTLHNRKGIELENKDPLDRFNAAIYGFNKTLPIATAQNSRNREITFESFEDQEYQTNACNTCFESGWLKIDTLKGRRSVAQSHSGKTSLEVFANKKISKEVVVNGNINSETPMLSFKIDSVMQVKTTVIPNGIGMTTRAGVLKAFMSPVPSLRINECIGRNISSIEWWPDNYIEPLSVNYGHGSPLAHCAKDYFAVQFTGELLVEHTDTYYFIVNVDDMFQMWLNGPNHIFNLQGSGAKWAEDTVGIFLERGQAYPIFTELIDDVAESFVHLRWRRNGQPFWEEIPLVNQYPSREAFNNSNAVRKDTTWCVGLRPVKQSNGLSEEFSPVSGTQMVVSGWVKEAALDPTGYKNSSINVSFTGSAVTYNLTPSGKIIDGWQRIEEVITMPPGATFMKYELVAGSAGSSFFDDLRIHPFNANMKSFVYDPVNIRLMAEMDENNYATFYEYDDEGTLVRVKKETERGVKTIKETRSALIKKEIL